MPASSIDRRAALGLLAGGLAAPAARAGDRPLTLAFVPQQNPEKLIGDVRAIARYLEPAVGRRVAGYVTQDHAAAIEALEAGAADISFMGALAYAIARARTGAVAVLSEIYRGRPSYSGAVFVRRDGGIADLAGLRGKSVAFADPISESGYLYPLELFAAAGLLARGEDPKRFFGAVYFAGGYQQAIQAVANGLVDAAGVSVYATLLLDRADRASVVALAETAPIPSHVVVARRGLEDGLRRSFVAAMLALNREPNRHLLRHVYGPDGFAEPDHAAYDRVARLARAYGLIRR